MIDYDKIFRPFYFHLPEGGYNPKCDMDNKNDAFELFIALYNISYGSIEVDENLVSIHTGGWSDNEEIISYFKYTFWWFSNLEIQVAGGHYYFNTDFYADKEWKIVKV